MAAITYQWSGGHEGIDVFFPARLYASLPDTGINIFGRAPRFGPCYGEEVPGSMRGVVVNANIGSLPIAWALAHELAHYLGLSHLSRADYPDNLMATFNYDDETVQISDNLLESQGEIMREHCSIQRCLDP